MCTFIKWINIVIYIESFCDLFFWKRHFYLQSLLGGDGRLPGTLSRCSSLSSINTSSGIDVESPTETTPVSSQIIRGWVFFYSWIESPFLDTVQSHYLNFLHSIQFVILVSLSTEYWQCLIMLVVMSVGASFNSMFHLTFSACWS